MTDIIKTLPITELKPFEAQPLKVIVDESVAELTQSIKDVGVLSPIIARPHKNGGYEILSGHRRVKACELGGIAEIPAVVKELDDDTAAILLVDSNLQRENILPSEKAFAYQFIESIMMEQKPEKVKFSLSDDIVKKYFPKSYTKEQIEDNVLKLIKRWHKNRTQERER